MLDPFEIRMAFLSHLRKLNASQASIQKVVSFAVKHGSRCADDIWDCILEECEHGSLNTRINVFYLLDSLCEVSLYVGAPDAPYLDLVTRDLPRIVDFVVPATSDGVLNLLSAKQILESWKTKRVIRPELVQALLTTLESRKSGSSAAAGPSKKRSQLESFSQQDTLRRMEEDRERHKRLRERIWVLPIPHSSPSTSTLAVSTSSYPTSLTLASSDPSPSSPFTPTSPAEGIRTPQTPKDVGERDKGKERAGTEVAIAMDLEFEQAWETTSDLNEDDFRDMEEENAVCFAPRPPSDTTTLPLTLPTTPSSNPDPGSPAPPFAFPPFPPQPTLPGFYAPQSFPPFAPAARFL